MQRSSRLFIGALLSTVGLLGATVTPASALGQASVASAVVDSSTRVRVEGTLVVFAGGDGVDTAVAATPLADEVRLVTPAGDSVVLTGSRTENVTTGSTFAGTVAVPTDAVKQVNEVVEEALGEAAPTAAADTVDAESLVGSEILAASETLDAPLAVVAATITAEAVQVGQTAMAHTLDVAVVTLPTAPAEIVMTDTAVDAMTTTLSVFWASQSAGQVASISRPAAVQRFESENACDPMAIWDEAAAKFGTDSMWYWGESAADHLVVIVPESCDDGFGAGVGTVGSLEYGGLIWAQSFAPVMASTLAHEFGHNVGLEHSNASECEENTAEGTACADKRYLDFYDVMGGGLYYKDATGAFKSNTQLMALNVTQKSRLSALTSSDLPTVALAAGIRSSQAAFALEPASAASGLRGLKVTDPRTGGVYFVEYRDGMGMDAGSLYASGLIDAELGLGPGVRVLRLRADGTSAVLRKPNADPTKRPLFMQAAQSFTSASGGLKVAVTGTGATAAVTVDLVAALPKLTATPVPTVSGTAKVGYTLTANPGTWGPATVTLKYQWYRSRIAISGATAKTYKLAAGDLAKTMTVQVTGSKAGYTSASKLSAATTAVGKGTLSAPTPKISGTRKVGYTLTATPGTWGPVTVKLTYRWYRSGVAIPYATAKTYKLVAADRYDTIKVRVVGSKTGYTSVAKYSASTAKVV